jgi:DNA repair protein RadC
MKNLCLASEVDIIYKSKVKNSERQQINQSKDCEKIFRSIAEYNDKINLFECFYAMYLNKANKVISVQRISEGSTAGTVIDNKKILIPAILHNSSGVIVSHNHPSGNLKPSENDLALTKRLKEVLDLINVTLLDHIILTDESYFSFADQNLL